MPATSDNAAIVTQLRRQIAALEAQLATERTDPITGLPTRRHWSRLAAAAYPDAGAVLLADLDGFKTVNDEHGHRIGDLLLAEIAERLRTTLGKTAVLGRLGGDEFAAVLPIVPAAHHLDQVHDWLTDPFTAAGSAELAPGVSLGVISGRQLAEMRLGEALHGADLAMYAAKAAGGGWRAYQASEHGPLAVTPVPARRVRQHGYTAA